MSKTAVVFSPVYYKHDTGRGHPESAERLRTIVDQLSKAKLTGNDKWQMIQPEKAQIEDVKLVHAAEYVKLVQAICGSGGGLLDLRDTVVSPESFDTALYAVGGALKAVDLVMKKTYRNAFALVRPPGHHADRFRACGFCVFNNIAIAAKHLLNRYGLRRVLILDVDAHHGNGTQLTFYGTSKVLYLSLHEDPYDFPGTGFADEIGEGEGLGYNVNIPLPYGTGDQIYLRAMSEIVEPIVCQYEPEFMLISAGFDGYYADPVGNLSLSASCIQQVYEKMGALASKVCQGRLVYVLEGGYNVTAVGRLVRATIAEMSGSPCVVKKKVTTLSNNAMSQGKKAIGAVRKIQSAHWNLGDAALEKKERMKG